MDSIAREKAKSRETAPGLGCDPTWREPQFRGLVMGQFQFVNCVLTGSYRLACFTISAVI